MAMAWSRRSPRPKHVGREMHELMRELFPIPRSLTGDGVRVDTRRPRPRSPAGRGGVAERHAVFDWTVPREWNVREAWVEAPDGRRVDRHGRLVAPPARLQHARSTRRIDLDELGSTSTPTRATPTSSLTEPRTGRSAGASARPGGWPTGSPGEVPRPDRLIARDRSRHVRRGRCSRARADERVPDLDDRLPSGARQRQPLGGRPASAASPASCATQELRHSFRLLWSPGHDRPALLAAHERDARAAGPPRLRGVVRRRPRPADVQAEPSGSARSTGRPRWCPAHRGKARAIRDWSPYGGDERQFCSPGFDLPFGALSRTPADAFPEYHSSADDLDLVIPRRSATRFTPRSGSSTRSSGTRPTSTRRPSASRTSGAAASTARSAAARARRRPFSGC